MLCHRLRLLMALVVCGALALVACGNSTGDVKTFLLPGGEEMEFVWIEGGTFFMGSPPSEAWRDSSERPWHEVEISEGFWLGKYEITQGQWEAVMGQRPWGEPWSRDGKDYVVENPSHPAVYISWEDVQDFIRVLNSAADSVLYRLPTEAEWEYACRAGTSTQWSFGDDERQLAAYAWYSASAWDVNEKYPHAVGLKRANPWGLHDMYGNVSEWVQDWYGEDYYNRSPRVDPLGPTTGYWRVVRGGSFYLDALNLWSAHRFYGSPDFPSNTIGARLLRIHLTQ